MLDKRYSLTVVGISETFFRGFVEKCRIFQSYPQISYYVLRKVYCGKFLVGRAIQSHFLGYHPSCSSPLFFFLHTFFKTPLFSPLLLFFRQYSLTSRRTLLKIFIIKLLQVSFFSNMFFSN